jgi:peptidoglycan/LPS O-acetylase OafA/YrhL
MNSVLTSRFLSRSTTRSGERLEIIECLRGLAAVAVMWFHFTYQDGIFAGVNGPGEWIGAKGWLGVEVFFVISGFILPYSMFRSRYLLRDCFTFVAKRIIRLDPPYLAAILLALGIWHLFEIGPYFHGDTSFAFEMPRFLCHLGYLNAIVGHPWYIPVFWTLAIEFQYYLFLALTFPLLVHKQSAVRNGFPILLAICALQFPVSFPLPQNNLLCSWFGLFALGMITFQAYCQLSSSRLYLALLALITAINLVSLGWIISLAGLVASLVISYVRIPRFAPLAFLGTISYSLYLVHLPVGVPLIRLGVLCTDSVLGRMLVLGIVIPIVLLAAHLWYRCFERPAQRWSSSLRYGVATGSKRTMHALEPGLKSYAK